MVQVTCYKKAEGSICQVVPSIPQVFHRIECDSLQELSDARFKYFTEEIYPKFSDDMHKHTLIFIPSYFDYVRVRNYLRHLRVDFGQICEYTKKHNILRSRSAFFHGQRRHLLYTERYHYHHRSRIRSIRHIIFYAPPTYPEFYPEMINVMEADAEITCTVLYTQFDALQLEQVVGSVRARRMLSSNLSTHMFT